ncbi:uncharacterized protein [Hoplias malabaricus]|uniref:uncharacterized protein n=1 Tax=Hoplias malabaricus TaxID=27720 RepID=UPI003462D131
MLLNMKRLFQFIFLLLIIETHSPNSVNVQKVPVGSTVKIPCNGYGDGTTAKWFYRGKAKNLEAIVSEFKGLMFKNATMWPGKRVLADFVLEISPFTELEEGLYVCQVCRHICTDVEQIYLLPHYETSSPSSSTQVIIEGGKFSYSCLNDTTLKVGWTFYRHEENTTPHFKSISAYERLLSIQNVQLSDVGKYSCWREATGQRYTVSSVNLCVLTTEKWADSSQNCTLYCDEDIDAEKNPVLVVTDKWNISFTGRIKKPRSSVICRWHNSSVVSNKSSLEDEDTTHTNAIEITGESSQAAILLSTCAAAFLIIVALVILLWVLRRRVNAERNSSNVCQTMTRSSGIESELIYSTLEVCRYQQENVIITSDNECVYSKIKPYPQL